MRVAWRVLIGVAASSAGMASCGGKSQTDAMEEGTGGNPAGTGAAVGSGGGSADGTGGSAAPGSGGGNLGGAGGTSSEEPIDLSQGDGIVFPMPPLLAVDGTDVLVAGKDLYPRELGLESTASGDAYVLRIDQNLEIVNEFRFSGAEPEVMARRSDGTLVIAGELWLTTQLGDETHEASDDAYYVAWLDQDLELIRSVVVDSQPTTWLHDVVFDQDGNAIVVGAHKVVVEDAPYSHESITVVSLDDSGTELWTREFEGTGSTAWVNDAELMPDGTLLFVGGFNYTLTIGEDVLDSGGDPYEGLFFRLDASDGAPILVQNFGGADYQYAFDAFVTEAGGVVVSGTAYGAFSFGGMNAEGHMGGGPFFAEVSDAGVASGLVALTEEGQARHILTESPEPQLIISFKSPPEIALGTWTDEGLTRQTIVQQSDVYPGEAQMDSQGHIWLTTQFGDSVELPVGSFLNGEGGVFGHDWVLWRLDPETL